MEFTATLATALIQCKDSFPVDFDSAWRWIGYSRKSDAKKALLAAGFIDSIDFQVLRSLPQNSKGGRPSEHIVLTIDCFKSLGMMAGTEKAREIRRYFLECERQLKKLSPALQHNLDQADARLEVERLRELRQLAEIDERLAWAALGQRPAASSVQQPIRNQSQSRPSAQSSDANLAKQAAIKQFIDDCVTIIEPGSLPEAPALSTKNLQSAYKTYCTKNKLPMYGKPHAIFQLKHHLVGHFKPRRRLLVAETKERIKRRPPIIAAQWEWLSLKTAAAIYAP